MAQFAYAEAAEFYSGRNQRSARQMRYRRFESAAEALRYAIEEMPPDLLRGSLLEVNERRFDGADLRALYDAEAYPLPRQSAG